MEEILFHLILVTQGCPNHLISSDFFIMNYVLYHENYVKYGHAKPPGIFLHRCYLLQLWCMNVPHGTHWAHVIQLHLCVTVYSNRSFSVSHSV